MEQERFSDVEITYYQGDSHLRGFARITVAKAIVLTGIKIIEGKNGLFISMPQREVLFEGKTKYMDIFYPVVKEVRKELEEYILAAYRSA